jgi:hypothetical protein
MKKQITLIIFAFLLLLSINFVSAEIQFFQEKNNLGNGTIQNHISLVYSRGGFGVADNYVTGNNPYEVYLLYNVYVKKFNNDNPNFRLNYCNLTIKFWGRMENTTSIVLDKSYIGTDDDVFNAKYFMKLNDGDGMIADEVCSFQNKSYDELDIPAEMQIVTPSWECKSCQMYEWSVQQKDITKADSIGDNVVSVSNYIKNLFMLNFEIWLALFWFFLIMLIFVSIGFIFVVGYWIYLYLRRIGR